MRVLTDEPFVPDPGSIFHMQEIILTMLIFMKIIFMVAVYHMDNEEYDDNLNVIDVGKKFPLIFQLSENKRIQSENPLTAGFQCNSKLLQVHRGCFQDLTKSFLSA